MKKRSIKQRILRGILTVLIVIVALVVIINLPIQTFSKHISKTDYSSWMSETLSNDQKVINIAMLGAHDAFSKDIGLFSPVDEPSADDIIKSPVGFFVKGFIVRQSVTQLATAEELLNAGVRYLDIRLTYDNGDWYTKHNYIAADFLPIADQITAFLDANDGEFLILDFQHIQGLEYASATDYQTFLDMLQTTGLLDYAYPVTDLGQLTYGDVTDNGTTSRVLILSQFESSNGDVLPYASSIRSAWANSDDYEAVVQYLETESETVVSESLMDRFRVMQGVVTMQMNGQGILKALSTWSLVVRAEQFNDYLIHQENFISMLDTLPIVMVDNATTTFRDFNEHIMQIIMDFNQNP